MLATIGQLLLAGLLIGLIYGVVAICIGVIYNATQIVNFAQGEFIMIGGVAAWVFVNWWKMPYWLAAVLAVAVGGILAIVIERTIINTARRFQPPMFTYVFLTFGVSIVLSNLALLLFGKNPMALDPFLGWEPIRFAGLSVPSQYALVFPLCILLVSGLVLFFSRVRIGKAMRAAAVNERGAKIVGIDTAKLSMTAFVMSGAISALVGVFLTPITTTHYAIGLSLTLKAFAAAILGGLGNFRGAILGGCVIGVVESLTAGLISSHFKEVITFMFILVLLIALPRGLMHSLVEERERV